METGFQSQWRAFLQLLTSPDGVIGIIAMFMLLVALLISPRVKWPVMMFMLWVATLSFQLRGGALIPVQLAWPINIINSQGRPICGALLVALLLPTALSHRGWRRHIVGWPALLLFLFQLMIGFRIAAGGVTDRGVLSMMLYVPIFLVMAVGLGRWLQDWVNARTLVRCIVGAGLLFLGTTCYQLAVGAGEIVHNHRLYGTTANPQQAGMLIAITLPPALYLIMRRGEAKIWRLFLGAVVAVLILFLLWTQSRTSIVVAVVGTVLLFRARLGKFLWVGLLVGIFVYFALMVFTESTMHITDIITRGDTRTRAWMIWWEQFRQNMAWGVMETQFGIGESSYLSAAANMGLFALIPMAAFMGATAWSLIKLQRIRRRLGEHVMMADLITAGLLSLAVGAMFEGYLLGTMTIQVFAVFIYMALMRFILDLVQASDAMQGFAVEPVGEAAEYEYATAAAGDGEHEAMPMEL